MAAVPLGSPLTDGDFEITLTGVSCDKHSLPRGNTDASGNPIDYVSAAGMSLCVISGEVRNLGSTPIVESPWFGGLITTNSRRYPPPAMRTATPQPRRAAPTTTTTEAAPSSDDEPAPQWDGTSAVKATDVASQIKARLIDTGETVTWMSCIDDLPAYVGATTTCNGVVDGSPQAFLATVKSVTGKTVNYTISKG